MSNNNKEDVQEKTLEIRYPGVVLYDEYNRPIAILEPPGPCRRPRIGFGASLYDEAGRFIGK